MPQPMLFNRRFWEDELPARLVEAAVTHVPRSAPGEGGVRLRQVERHVQKFSFKGKHLGMVLGRAPNWAACTTL